MSYIYTLRYVFDPRTNTPEKDRKLLDLYKKPKLMTWLLLLMAKN